VKGWVVVGEERVNVKGKRSRILSMYFIHLHENRRMKPSEIFLSRGKNQRMTEGMNLTKVQIWNCDNETPLIQLIYVN
jgi:hypothetical protein